MIRVVLPAHLKMLAKVSGEVELEVAGTTSPASGSASSGECGRYWWWAAGPVGLRRLLPA